jgi:hypothetical protein
VTNRWIFFHAFALPVLTSVVAKTDHYVVLLNGGNPDQALQRQMSGSCFCDGVLTESQPGCASGAPATTIIHVPGRQSGSLP